MSRPLRYRTDLDKGIGQHHFDDRDHWTMDDVVGIVCLVGMIAWLIWLCWSVWESV